MRRFLYKNLVHLFYLDEDIPEVENTELSSKSSPVATPTPTAIDDDDENHVENINIIFIGHVGKIIFKISLIILFYIYKAVSFTLVL